MGKAHCICILLALLAASSIYGEEAESRQFSSNSYYIFNPGEGGEDHVRFPDDEAVPEDLDASESIGQIQGLQLYAIQNGNIPFIIYPVSNTGATSPADSDDQHGLASINHLKTTQPETSDNGFEESLKNVAHGYIFPSNPATTHTDIFKQLLEAGSQGPAPEPYVIPTPQMNKQVAPDPIIAIPMPSGNSYTKDQPQQSLLTAYNIKQYTSEPVYLSQSMETIENQQQPSHFQHSSGVNDIPVELQYLKDKPSHYHMVGPQVFIDEENTEPPKDQDMSPPPYRESQKMPLQPPPPPMKASTYGPPQPVHTPPSVSHSNHYRSPSHRPPNLPHPPTFQTKGIHTKGPTKVGPPHHPFRLHSGPHQHHGGHHHHGHQYHHHAHHHPDSHYHHPPSKFHRYEVHEMNSIPHLNRLPLHSTYKHPYSFHYHSPPKPNSFSGPAPSNSGMHGSSRPSYHNQETPNKPPFGFGSQKGTRPYGPPKSSSYNSMPNTNLVTSHPSITKAIFHSPHSSEQTSNQNGDYSPAKESLSYPPGIPEYIIDTSPSTHPTPSYGTKINSHRPSDASPTGSISEPYVTGPPRVNYSDEEEEEPSPPVEVYSPLSEQYYGTDSYQRMKQPFKVPVIVYKGVRPPVRVYQKPETGPPYHHLPAPHSLRGSITQPHKASHSYAPPIESTWINHNSASTPYYHQQRVRGSYSVASPSASSKSADASSPNVSKEAQHMTSAPPFRSSPSSASASGSSPVDSLSSSSDDSSSWTPINAPAGAVPARAYHIPAPDLSREVSHPINHNSYYSSANSRADIEDLVLTEQSGNSHSLSSSLPSNTPLISIGSNQLRIENNSEVVSAVVLVKHR